MLPRIALAGDIARARARSAGRKTQTAFSVRRPVASCSASVYPYSLTGPSHGASGTAFERSADAATANVTRETMPEPTPARGEHLCMTMRGARTPALMTSSALGGRFKSDGTVRGEFLRLATAPHATR